MGDDAPATPKRGGLFGNVGAMLESGGFMAAVGAVLKGHSMTEEQAVLFTEVAGFGVDEGEDPGQSGAAGNRSGKGRASLLALGRGAVPAGD